MTANKKTTSPDHPDVGRRRSRFHRRLTDDRGAALIEFSLVTLLLATIGLGTFELGTAWSDSQLVTQAARSGARVAAQMSDDPNADVRIVEAIEAALGDLTTADVRIVIYDAAAPDGAMDGPCVPANPPGKNGKCSVYDESHFTTFSQGSWDPGDRTTDLLNPVYIGVLVEVQRPSLTGLFSPLTFDMHDTAVMRAEPEAP